MFIHLLIYLPTYLLVFKLLFCKNALAEAAFVAFWRTIATAGAFGWSLRVTTTTTTTTT